jgi:hypothetical protein
VQKFQSGRKRSIFKISFIKQTSKYKIKIKYIRKSLVSYTETVNTKSHYLLHFSALCFLSSLPKLQLTSGHSMGSLNTVNCSPTPVMNPMSLILSKAAIGYLHSFLPYFSLDPKKLFPTFQLISLRIPPDLNPSDPNPSRYRPLNFLFSLQILILTSKLKLPIFFHFHGTDTRTTSGRSL